MEKVKLNELADIYLGVTHTPEYVFEGVPFLSVKDISSGKICFDDCKYISQEEYDSLSEGAKPKVGDMLFCRVGTLGKPIIIPEGTPLFGSFVSLGYLRNKDEDRCDLNYLRYWMFSNSFWKQVYSNVKGASQVNLNTGWLSKFNIDLPDINVQKYRISVLDKCKTIIEQRETELSKLDDVIKARFVELFGDAVVNPMGWAVKELQELVTDDCTISYGIVQTGDDQEEGVPVFRPVDIVNRVPIRTELKKTTEVISNKYKRTILKGRELLITVRANIADTCIIGEEFAGCNVGRGIVPIRTDENVMILEFLKHQLDSKHLNDNIKAMAKGITLIQLNMEDLRAVKLMVPPIEQQKAFVEFAAKLDKSKVVDLRYHNLVMFYAL